MNRKPNFFIVGAPKCGTTSMYQYLSQHPDIFMSKIKEPHFFGGGRNSYPNTSWGDYLSLFNDAIHEKCIGEASTRYLYSEDACKRIHKHDANAKIIIMLRNPVDMIYSWHAQLLWNCVEDEKDFRCALELETKRRNGLHMPKTKKADLQDWRLMYRACGCYSAHVKRYLEMFGKDRLHIIIFENFVQNTKVVYQELLEFFEVDSCFVPELPVANPNKYPRWWPIQQWIQTSESFPKKMILRFVPQRIRRFANKLTYYKQQRPPMPEDLRIELTEYFSDDVMKLEKLINIDLSVWKAL